MGPKRDPYSQEPPSPGSLPELAMPEIETASHRLRRQYAALPYRFRKDGQIEILLVTSISTRRWIIPKGWPMGKRPPHKVAAQEAAEEAGVEGRIGKSSIGHYHYEKMLSNGAFVPCRVDIFALEVRKLKSAWPERKRRERKWLLPEEAADLVGDAELAPILRAFAPAPRPTGR
ncbi:MAG: hypothetical protein O9322_08105 [Beijerinckiaceae bacterium]|nr:hypothetical protein [Beijerinckiaceae bacterium]MCZ8299489.1 hypothetical protein [Beijerinckiaceae bacterium]